MIGIEEILELETLEKDIFRGPFTPLLCSAPSVDRWPASLWSPPSAP